MGNAPDELLFSRAGLHASGASLQYSSLSTPSTYSKPHIQPRTPSSQLHQSHSISHASHHPHHIQHRAHAPLLPMNPVAILARDSPPAQSPVSISCSADDTTSETDYFTNSIWVDHMTQCMNDLNRETWHGEVCSFSQAPFAPNIGSYKGGKNWDSPTDCFNACSACVQKGINNRYIKEVICRADAGHGSNCWMGYHIPVDSS